MSEASKGMVCKSCHATTSNGLALCELCQMRLAKNLEFLPVTFANLSRWRPGRAGSRSVPGSREPRRPGDRSTKIERTLDEAGASITGWARMLVDDRPTAILPSSNDETASVRVACWFLTEHLTTIATLPWCGEIVRDTSVYHDRLFKLTADAVPGWYAGRCRVCEADTYVIPGLTWLTCQQCGATSYAGDHLDKILEEARVWLARPKHIAEALVALMDVEQSVPRLYARIRQWASSGDITGVREVRREYVCDPETEAVVLADVEHGYARYTLGEVHDRLLRSYADTSSGEDAVRAS